MDRYSMVLLLIAISVSTADDTSAMATLDVPQAVTHYKDEGEGAQKWTGAYAPSLDEDRALTWFWSKSKKELSEAQLKAIDEVYDRVFPNNDIANLFSGKNLNELRKGVRKVASDDSGRYLADLLMRKKGAGKLSNEVDAASNKLWQVSEIITNGQLSSWKHHNTPLKEVVAALFPNKNLKDESRMNAEFPTALKICKKYAIATHIGEEDVMTDVAAAMEEHLGAKDLSFILERLNYAPTAAHEFRTALFQNWISKKLSVQSAFELLELDKGHENIFSRPQMLTFFKYASVVTKGDTTKQFDLIITLISHYKSIDALHHAIQSAPAPKNWNFVDLVPKVKSMLSRYEAQHVLDPPANSVPNGPTSKEKQPRSSISPSVTPHAVPMPRVKHKPASPSSFEANEPHLSSGNREPSTSLHNDRPHAKPASPSPPQRARDSKVESMHSKHEAQLVFDSSANSVPNGLTSKKKQPGLSNFSPVKPPAIPMPQAKHKPASPSSFKANEPHLSSGNREPSTSLHNDRPHAKPASPSSPQRARVSKVESMHSKHEAQHVLDPPANSVPNGSTSKKKQPGLSNSPPVKPHADPMPQAKHKPASPSSFKANEPHLSSGKKVPSTPLHNDRPHAKPASPSSPQRARVSKVESMHSKHEAQHVLDPPAKSVPNGSTSKKKQPGLSNSPPVKPHADPMPQAKHKPASPSSFKANEPHLSSGKKVPSTPLYNDRPHAKPASPSPPQRTRVSNSPIARFRRWLSKVWAKIRALWHSE